MCAPVGTLPIQRRYALSRKDIPDSSRCLQILPLHHDQRAKERIPCNSSILLTRKCILHAWKQGHSSQRMPRPDNGYTDYTRAIHEHYHSSRSPYPDRLTTVGLTQICTIPTSSSPDQFRRKTDGMAGRLRRSRPSAPACLTSVRPASRQPDLANTHTRAGSGLPRKP